MVIVNKLAVQTNGLPSIVSGAQLVVGAFVPALLEMGGMKVMGPIERRRILPLFLYTNMFALSLFSNMKALMLTNVGAVIAARSCLPLIVCVIEFLLMGRSLPNRRSVASLMGVVGGASVYVLNDSGIKVTGTEGIFWIGSWWVLVALQMTYGKVLTDKIVMSQWERVFYNNFFCDTADDSPLLRNGGEPEANAFQGRGPVILDVVLRRRCCYLLQWMEMS